MSKLLQTLRECFQSWYKNWVYIFHALLAITFRCKYNYSKSLTHSKAFLLSNRESFFAPFLKILEQFHSKQHKYTGTTILIWYIHANKLDIIQILYIMLRSFKIKLLFSNWKLGNTHLPI